jgi:hypothetical protein
MGIDQETVGVSRNATGAKQGGRAPVIGAMGRGKKERFLDIIALIRSIQRAEGNIDCFRREKVNCDQVDCAWRPYCL